MLRTILSRLALASALIAPHLHAAPIIDQDQPVVNAAMAAFVQGDLAQSFKQNASNIAGAGIFLWPGAGTPDSVSISLYDALPNASGNLLASASATGTPGAWVDVFWSPVTIAPNSSYFLVFDSPGASLIIAGDDFNSYASGIVYANSGFVAFPDYDYTFRTYADISASRVPVPGSLALLGLGLATLVGVHARRRR